MSGDLGTIRQVTDTSLELFVAIVFHVLTGQPVRNQLLHAIDTSQDSEHSADRTRQLETIWHIIEVRGQLPASKPRLAVPLVALQPPSAMVPCYLFYQQAEQCCWTLL